jgi:serine/threonine kinase 16
MNSDTLAIALDRVRFYAKDALITLAQVGDTLAELIQSVYASRAYASGLAHFSDATLKINGRSYKIVKFLGEGGFSFVYLINDTSSGRVYALKKIMASGDAIQAAMKEIEAYRRFRHPNIIKILDSAVVQEGDGKIVYL